LFNPKRISRAIESRVVSTTRATRLEIQSCDDALLSGDVMLNLFEIGLAHRKIRVAALPRRKGAVADKSPT
jgi:hypothetical protein